MDDIIKQYVRCILSDEVFNIKYTLDNNSEIIFSIPNDGILGEDISRDFVECIIKIRDNDFSNMPKDYVKRFGKLSKEEVLEISDKLANFIAVVTYLRDICTQEDFIKDSWVSLMIERGISISKSLKCNNYEDGLRERWFNQYLLTRRTLDYMKFKVQLSQLGQSVNDVIYKLAIDACDEEYLNLSIPWEVSKGEVKKDPLKEWLDNCKEEECR